MKVSISLFLVVLFSVCAPGLRAEKGKESQPPNLVVLLADDLGYGDLGCTGSLQIPTPNIDNLAKQGVFCSRAYVSAPMCAPSRMALLTGRFPKRYGITTNPNSKIDYLPESHYGLPQTEKCLPQYLAEFGYNSAVIGNGTWDIRRDTSPPTAVSMPGGVFLEVPDIIFPIGRKKRG